MAMDEVQDLTINRTRQRLEQTELLGNQFVDFLERRSDHQVFSGNFIHVRVVLQPILEQTITISDQLLNTLGNANPPYRTTLDASTSTMSPLGNFIMPGSRYYEVRKESIMMNMSRPVTPILCMGVNDQGEWNTFVRFRCVISLQ